MKKEINGLQVIGELARAETCYYHCFEGVHVIIAGGEAEPRNLLLEGLSFVIDACAEKEPDKDGSRHFSTGSPVVANPVIIE